MCQRGAVEAAGARDLIFLEPVIHEMIWGGRRLQEYGYNLPSGPVGECWAISGHSHGDCVVYGGPWSGWHLSELWERHRELFGGLDGRGFPLLVKILDAHDDLSIQVHPDDAYAAAHEHGSLGKRECWYVLDAKENATIIVGQKARDRSEFRRLVAEGRWEDLLNEIPVHGGDFFQIEPGTVHAIKGGTLILETQQSSDVTYRVYDYDRRQADGSLREIHLDKALDVIDFAAQAPTAGAVLTEESDGVTCLVETPSYVVDRIVVRPDKPVVLCEDWPFLCVSVVEGAGTVIVAGTAHDVTIGTHFVAPSGCGALLLRGDMTLVASHVPGL